MQREDWSLFSGEGEPVAELLQHRVVRCVLRGRHVEVVREDSEHGTVFRLTEIAAPTPTPHGTAHRYPVAGGLADVEPVTPTGDLANQPQATRDAVSALTLQAAATRLLLRCRDTVLNAD